MDKEKIIRRVLSKLSKDEVMTLDKAKEIIFDDFVKKEEVVKQNYQKKIMINNKQHDSLRKIYDEAPVKKLYSYGLSKFGFKLENLRFDVESTNVEIKREK